MTIFVTGGAGFIGSNFVINWLAEHHEPLVNLDKLTYAGNLDNLQSVKDHDSYHFIQGDIADQAVVDACLQQHQPRAIVHFAAETHVDRSIHTPEQFIHTNIVGTYRLLESAKNYYNQLASTQQSSFRFLHVSTDEVYGSLTQDEPGFSETHPYQPNSPYSASKAASDHLVRAYFHTYQLPVLTTNCSNNYGPYQFPEKLIPLIIHNALAGKALPIYGDGLQVRDWLYVKDHTDAIGLVLAKGRLGETYNIGGNNELANIQVVHTLCEILDAKRPRSDGLSYKQQITFVTDRPGHDRRYAIDAGKIQQELGFVPQESFKSGMEKTVHWYLDHQDWVGNVTSGGYRQWLETQYQ